MRASLYDAGKPGKQDAATVQATTMLTILPGTTITLRTLPSPMNFAPCGSASAAASIASRGQRSEEHTSELPSLMRISYAVFFLNKTHNTKINDSNTNETHNN